MDKSIFNPLKTLQLPIYKGIAQCIEQGINKGEMQEGEKLLTHRALAKLLEVSPVTVRQAYQELEKSHLIKSTVGKGTFISASVKLSDAITEDLSAEINLSIIKPIETPFLEEFKPTILQILEKNLSASFDYNTDTVSQEHEKIAQKWVERRGITLDKNSLLVCSGAQHALLVSLLASTKAGDAVAVEAFCYPGILAVLKHCERRPVSIALNEFGMNPEALKVACQKHAIKAVVVVASCHNPTGKVMPNSQRQDIANVADTYNLSILDDDIYGFLCYPEYKPLWTFLPNNTYYIDSLSKSVAPTLRTAFIVVPKEQRSKVMNLIRSTIWFCSPLLQELSFNLIADGKAEKIASWQKTEIRKRQALAATILPPNSYTAYIYSPIIWLELPDHWTSATFVRELDKQGVHVTEDFYFSETRQRENGHVRISLVGTKHTSQLEKALHIITNTLNNEASLGGF